MPLLRVAHPSDEDSKRELERLKQQSKQSRVDSSDEFARDISTKGVPKTTAENNPLLFDFNHNYDPELTPRRSWQQRVKQLEAQLDQINQKHSSEIKLNDQQRLELEKSILILSNKLEASETANEQLQERLDQEIIFKDDYHKSFKRAHFDLEKVENRYAEEKRDLQSRLQVTEDCNHKLNQEIKSLKGEFENLKDENQRLKNTIVNKDSANQSLQQFLDREKERREAETNELRKMLSQEQDRAIRAVREAEQNISKQDLYKNQLEKMEQQVTIKEKRIAELLSQCDQLRNDQIKTEKTIIHKMEQERSLQQGKIEDKTNSLQIQLNKREADLQRMEAILLEMHAKMDTMNQEKKDAVFEAKESYKAQFEAERRLDSLLVEAKMQREIQAQALANQESKLHQKSLEAFKVGITVQALERKVDEQAQEIARLRNVASLNHSVANLPYVCVENLTDDRIREIKQSALHTALTELRTADKGRDDLIMQIEDLERKSKKAYLSLYERVGDEIGRSLHKTVQQREAEIFEKNAADQQKDSAQIELERLKAGVETAESKVGKTSLEGLFRKYNI